MREGFNNNLQQMQLKKSQQKSQVAQLSQRSAQMTALNNPGLTTQKPQSIPLNKISQSQNNQGALTAYEEQSLQPTLRAAILNPQQLASNQSRQVTNIHSNQNSSKPIQILQQQQINPVGKTHQINSGIGGAVHHKKANSMMNSKMAQLLLKGVTGTQIVQSTQNQLANNSANIGQNIQQVYSAQKKSQVANSQNVTGIPCMQMPQSNQSSFGGNEILFHKDIDYKNLQDQQLLMHQAEQFHYMNQAVSNKNIGGEQFSEIVAGIQESSFKKQSKNSNQKQSQIKMSSSKSSSKKGQGGTSAYHQRIKSENFHNRGSITSSAQGSSGIQTSTQKSLRSSQQQKRHLGAGTLKNNFVEFHPQFEQPASKGHAKHSSIGSACLVQPPESSQTRKGLSQQQQFQQQQKKSTKEKYQELKALYNDLLERHYALAAQTQNQQSYNQLQQVEGSLQGTMGSKGSNQNLINFYAGQASREETGQLSSKNQNKQESNTPRILMNQQISNSNLGNNLQLRVSKDFEDKDTKVRISKTLKHTSGKAPEVTDPLKPGQPSSSSKVCFKQQLPQGQSRKGASQHKRSVSDGNEQLFKFKQAAMQRYLYPQPSNQTLQAQEMAPQQQMKSLEQRNKAGGAHQRQASDDYSQKIKKQQMHLQQQVAQQTKAGKHGENVPLEVFDQHQQPPSVDFNIKGFLIEMRNKQGSNIRIVEQLDAEEEIGTEEEPYHQKHTLGMQENSPLQQHFEQFQELKTYQAADGSKDTGPSLTLESNRKPSDKAVAVSHQQQQQRVKKQGKTVEKFKQKNVQLQLVENQENVAFEGKRRMQSPSFEQSIKLEDNSKMIPSARPGTNHKRVKSDVPETSLLRKDPSLHQGKRRQKEKQHPNLLYSDRTTPKKGAGATKKLAWHQQQHVFPATQDESDSKKVINVSIDLVQDASGELDSSSLEGCTASQNLRSHIDPSGKYIQVDQSVQNLNLQDLLQQKGKAVKGGVKSQGYSGSSNDALRQEKYAKMKQMYANKQSERAATREEEKSHREGQEGGELEKRKGGQKLPGTPKMGEKVFKKKDIKPSQKIHSTPVQQSKHTSECHSLVQNQQQQQQVIQVQKKPTAAPTNSVVQTQESPRNSQIMAPSQQLIIGSDVRVDTQDSTISDPSQSPCTRLKSKLIRHIKLSFHQTGQPPQTTVDFYRIGKVLGKGAFGKVNLSLHKLTQKFAAVKSINKQYLSEEAHTKKVMQEVMILKRTRHRNIVRLYEFFETQKHIVIVIELCAGGDLLNYVRKRRKLKEEVAKFIFKQLIEGLGYCHSKNILHRDIKLDNVLLDAEGEVKICDFGVSKLVKKGEKMTEQCGTPAYIAPEILRDKGYEGFAVDIWSAGVVLYAMLYGTVPFKANNMSELQKLIMKAKYTLKEEGVSEEARSLIRACLEKDPAQRITIPEILKHEWLSDIDETLQLFTEQEKEYIKNEFTYNDADRYNRNEGADPFTDHMLDSTQNSMLKNCTSKSVILAPFNSTKSNLEMEEEGWGEMEEQIKELMQSKRCLKFAARVRDVDKQYEMNNNKELDNGVYHKFEEEEKENSPQKNAVNESDDSLQSSFNKMESLKSDVQEETLRIREEERKKKNRKKKKQTELEKLESMIQQEEEDEQRDEIKIQDQEGEDLNPYGEIESNQSVSDIKHASPKKESNVLQSAQTLIIDEAILQQVEQYGYPKEYIIRTLNNNELNYATTSYHLLLNKHAFCLKDNFIESGTFRPSDSRRF